MAPVSRICIGMNALRRDNPWPDFGYGEIEPFYLPLDGGGRGGRELIIETIKSRKIKLMAEIGCFLCGSSIQWLKASSDLTVLGIDPWDGNWAAYIEQIAADPLRARTVWHFSDEQIATIVYNLRRFGNYGVALNNVRLYKERFVPIRRKSPEALHYLFKREIVPELIYIDSDKQREDLEVARKLFPNAILCGDDWLWFDETGAARMQDNVKAFAADYNYEIKSARQSWLLVAPETAPSAPENAQADAPADSTA
jgi:hypothetical protein